LQDDQYFSVHEKKHQVDFFNVVGRHLFVWNFSPTKDKHFFKSIMVTPVGVFCFSEHPFKKKFLVSKKFDLCLMLNKPLVYGNSFKM
jgi:hypothetical protein